MIIIRPARFESEGRRTAKTIPSRPEGGDTLLLERVDDLVEGRPGVRLCVICAPFLEVEWFLFSFLSAQGFIQKGKGHTPEVITSAGIGSPFR